MSRTNTYLRQLPPGLTHIDVYWVLRLFNVTDPCAQHAVKKLLADGSGDKDRAANMREAWETLDRWVEMEREQVLERYSYQDDVQPDPVMQDAQRPPDRPADGRPSIHNCPSGANCREDCGLGPCQMESSE